MGVNANGVNGNGVNGNGVNGNGVNSLDGGRGSLDVGLELMYLLQHDGDVCRASIATLWNPSRAVDTN